MASDISFLQNASFDAGFDGHDDTRTAQSKGMSGTEAVASSTQHRENENALMKTIQRLKASIADIRRQLRESENLDKSAEANLEDIMNHLLRTSDRKFVKAVESKGLNKATAANVVPHHIRDTDADDQVPTKSTFEQLRSLAAFTGIEFNHASSTIIQKDVRKYHLKGSSSGLGFEMHFDVTVDQAEGVNRIANLNVNVPREILPEMGQFVAAVEEERALHTFFRGMTQYGRWNARRRLLFKAFKSAFPEMVALPYGARGGTSMIMGRKDQSGLCLALTWAIQMHTNTQPFAEPHVSVKHVGDLHAASEAHRNGILNLNETFSKLVSVCGLDEAVVHMMDLVIKSA